MTAGTAVEPGKGGKHMTLIKRAMIPVLGAPALGAILNLMNGRPRSSWFYPFIIGVGLLGGIATYRRAGREAGAGDDPPKPVAAALLWAMLSGAMAGATLYGIFRLGWGEPNMWAMVVFLASIMAVTTFRQKRGKKYTARPVWLLTAAFIAIALVLRFLRK